MAKPESAPLATPTLADPRPKFDSLTAAWFILLHGVAVAGPVWFFSWSALAVFVSLYFSITIFGITLGYHRLFSHRAFKTSRSFERFLATMGLLAFQGSPVEWVAIHRMHHAFVDTPDDPHNSRRGLWWSHVGWMLYPTPDLRDATKLRRFARDLSGDPYIDALTGLWPMVGLQLVLALSLWLLGGWNFVVWGVFVRCALGYHTSWSLNSFAHRFGYRSFSSDDASTNSWWLALLGCGEGWHNNHHAFPSVARNGHRWWEVDLTYLLLQGLERIGLVYDIKQLPQDLHPLQSERSE